MKSVKILFIGEIVGKYGVFCVKSLLNQIKTENGIDFVIANGDSTTGGFGIGKNHSIYLQKLGVDVITSGECIYYKKDMVEQIMKAHFILRAANYPKDNPGRGWMIYKVNDYKIGVICLLGQASFNRVHLQNPFLTVSRLIEKIKEQTNIILIDFHASTTAEKYTMFHYLKGKVSAIIGTHMKILSADNTIFDQYTAAILDAGRTGSQLSVNGLEADIEIKKFLDQIPAISKPCGNELELQGVIVDINKGGKALSIDTIRKKVEVR